MLAPQEVQRMLAPQALGWGTMGGRIRPRRPWLPRARAVRRRAPPQAAGSSAAEPIAPLTCAGATNNGPPSASASITCTSTSCPSFPAD